MKKMLLTMVKVYIEDGNILLKPNEMLPILKRPSELEIDFAVTIEFYSQRIRMVKNELGIWNGYVGKFPLYKEKGTLLLSIVEPEELNMHGLDKFLEIFKTKLSRTKLRRV
ncbi:MAG: hypothetical protein PHS46_06795 [Candidatus Omnitrophica bacterium]|nr:hypothetical protein [Candidatus Omnitrophota bacterium]